MPRKVMITCAVTGSADTPSRNPAVPVTPEQIAASALDAARAGAAIVHLHVREPGTGAPSMEPALYREVVERIRGAGSDVVLNLTTGAGARFVPGEEDPLEPAEGTWLFPPDARVAHVVELRPELCSLDVATFNFGERAFINTPGHLRRMARAIRSAGVLPELEVFEPGHIRLARHLIETGELDGPGLFQVCLGIAWAQPATPEAMLYMRGLLPPDAVWFAFGIGPAELDMAAQAVLLGGHVRVGLEDNLYLRRGELAPSNAALVERAVAVVRSLDHEPATPAEARALLGLTAHPDAGGAGGVPVPPGAGVPA